MSSVNLEDALLIVQVFTDVTGPPSFGPGELCDACLDDFKDSFPV